MSVLTFGATVDPVLTLIQPRMSPSLPLPISWWITPSPLDGGVSLYDLIGMNSGTLTNMTAAGTSGWRRNTRGGAVGPCLIYDGTDDEVVIAAAAPINFLVTDSFTVNSWVNITVTGNTQMIVNRQENVLNEFVYYMYINSTEKAVFGTAKQGVGGNSATGATTLTINKWYMVTAVGDGTNLTIYLNGISDGTNTYGLTLGSTQNVSTMRLGQGYAATQCLTGFIDDVAIFNLAFSAQQVRALYLESLAGYPTMLPRLRRVTEPGVAATGAPAFIPEMLAFHPMTIGGLAA